MTRILVIKLGALGDFIQALGPFQTIRRGWPEAHVVLLTTRPFVDIAQQSGLFNEIWVDSRPKPWQIRGVLTLAKKLAAGNFDWVYDLQTSDRSSYYYRLLRFGKWLNAEGGPLARRTGPGPKWSGIARGCSHPHTNPQRNTLHTLERHREQLEQAGLTSVPANLSFLQPSPDFLRRMGTLPHPYVILVPGSAPHRPRKRWPYYGRLAGSLMRRGISCIVVAGKGEKSLADALEKEAHGDLATHSTDNRGDVPHPGCDKGDETMSKKEPGSLRNLVGETTLGDIAHLARHALGAVGNDTGPMHIIAAVGCPSVVLFSGDSDPQLCSPRRCDSSQSRHRITILREDNLTDLSTQVVEGALYETCSQN